MNKVIEIPIKNTLQYLQIFNGMFKLTDKELLILTKFIDKHKELSKTGVDVFSAPVKKLIADDLGIEDFNTLNIYVKAFKDKHVIRKTSKGYQFNKLVIMQPEESGVLFKWRFPSAK